MALTNSDLPKLVELLNLIDIRVKVRRKTATEWVTSNEVLLSGEWGKETDTGKLKQGNGVTPWNSLDYYSTGTSLGPANEGANIDINATNPDVPIISSTLGAIQLKGTVANYAALPSSGNTAGDAYLNDADKLIYVWSGSAWPSSGQGLNFGNGWTRTFSDSLTSNSNWAGYCGRTVYPPLMFPFGAKKVRLLFKAGSSSLAISKGRICKSKNSASGQPIEYDGTPSVITWNGANSITIPANTYAASDEITVSIPALSNVVLALDVNASNAATGTSGTSNGARTYYVTGTDAINSAVGSYILSTASYGLSVAVIEITS